jgi:peptidoglycan/xylan/chitin deacetylase (PgdA/CDA1 family)
VALAEKDDRTDEATVALPAQPALSTPETVAADEPTAKLPETLDGPAKQPSSDEGVTVPLAGLIAGTQNRYATPGRSGQAAAEPDDLQTAADATMPIPVRSDLDEVTAALSASPKAAGPNAFAPHWDQPEADPNAADPNAEPAADATVAIPSDLASPPADGTDALPSAVPTREPAPARRPGQILVDRRRLLLAGAGVVAAAVVGGIAVEAAGRKPEAAGSHVRSGKPTAVTTTRSRAPEATHVTAPPVAVQRAPIFTLPEYRKATGAGPFPADAVALTIDDGPHPVWTPKILQLLERYHVPAMFCVIGNQVLGHENIARMVTAAGHRLANHTWSHPTSLAKKTGDVVHGEMLRAQEKIHDTTGYTPRFFRSPGGVWSPMVLQQTAAAGLLPLDWTNDPKDWSRPGVGKIEHTMLAAHPGQILLCHDGGGDRSQTYNALKVVLPQLKARGLRFVAL